MIEKLITLEHVDPVVFLGVNNAHLQLLKTLYPKVRILARGSVLKISGSEQDVEEAESKLHQLIHVARQTNVLTSDTIVKVVKGDTSSINNHHHRTILFGINGKPIVPRSHNQEKLVKAYDKDDLLFAIGPAGSGKTYVAIALAVKSLKNKEVKRIILSRPAVEAGEKLGFLPGDMKEKIDPYLQPLYDALEDMIPPAKLKDYMDNKTIQIAPLAFMRGRTLSDAVVILDEAQNTSVQQIKMFMTRLGTNAKMIITGDLTQIDLPPSQLSGLKHAIKVLKDIKGISQIHFDKEDIVRHKLVQQIVEAYDKDAGNNKRTL